MRYLSLFSGIEAASVAWSPIEDWEPAAFAEIDPFCRAVLKHHYPHVPNLGDVTKWKEWGDLGTIDLICGGSPCQSFSVAGLRKGMDDPRGNLLLVYLAIVDRYRPRWILFENVPGILSSNGGRDFGSFLGAVAELGYGFAYKILDAQHTRVDGFPRAVPQRRRRVFVVGCLGDWASAAAVLSERQSLLGDTAPRRKAGQGAAPTIGVGAHGSSGHQYRQKGNEDALIPSISNALAARDAKQPRAEDNVGLVVTHSLKAEGFDASEDGTGRGVPLIADTITSCFAKHHGASAGKDSLPRNHVMTLAIRGRGDGCDLETRDDGTANAVLTPSGGRAGIGVGAVAFDGAQITSKANRSTVSDISPTMAKESQLHSAQSFAVRRLMPVECERLMGFPDGYTDVPYRGRPAADGPRYRALGNSWAVNCVRWIGRRIEMVESLVTESLP